ncbi:gluconate:proton symporter [Acinetobacter sp. ANC 4558]|uniref:gluconate:proton symporter n=1 Tax=Acinetobacter sp. ANC 4558 TaxID=1977876 RepID=UPI000A339926|nr:gluconate:proton symporter [Acinetobacter sp. ANC 4558]OTG85454.1 gluconate:proton symporter [Acinetobacter sp. ANC 4558]
MSAAQLPSSVPNIWTKKNSVLILLIVLSFVIAFYARGLPISEIGIIGFLPIVALALLTVVGLDIVLAVIIAILISVVMTSTSVFELGGILAHSTGSFIATVGLIIMLGAGVGEVANRTGAAKQLVRFIVYKVGLSSQNRVKLGIMMSSVIICGSLGTMAGGNAIIVAVIIPIAAAVGLTPPTVALLLMVSGSVGLFMGPFTPSTVTILELGGLTYPQYLISCGIPMSIVTLLTGWFMSGHIQKWTSGKYSYHENFLNEADEAETTEQLKRSKRAAMVFIGTILVMAVIGIIFKAGFSFAIIVMLTVAALTGLAAGYSPKQILDALYQGCGKLVWMFILYWLYNPILELVDKLDAYHTLLESATPYLVDLTPAMLCFGIFLFNIVGHIPGAAVAQMTFTHKIFGPILMANGVPPVAVTAVLLSSSQVDWFGPFPSSDMFGQMGLARSNQLKYMLYGGWAIVVANIALFAVMFQVLT